MIISSTPLRISIGGGGTDLPFYYEKHGGFVIAATIKKYIFITIANHFEKIIKLNYSETEVCRTINQIKHPIIKESLKLMGLKDHIQISSIADLPASSGLGSSGSFTVGLLNAINAYLGKSISQKKLAEQACHIEMDLLKEPVGKQDQYIAAFGGFSCISINKNGNVRITPLKISNETVYDLEHNLIFFHTGIKRSASKILNDQKKVSKRKDLALESLTNIKKIGYDIKKMLEKDNLDEFGELMDQHWHEKIKTSNQISNEGFDRIYENAMKNGALGGKIIGAGGGGFFMFYTNNRKNKLRLRKKFVSMRLKEVIMPFESQGSKVMLNLESKWK